MMVLLFSKMNSQKCKLNVTILQTNLEIGSTYIIGIMNQVQYRDNQLNLNFNILYYMLWTISWFGTRTHNFTKFISWITWLYFTKNDTSWVRFSESLPMTSSTKILIDLSYPTLDHVCSDCLYIAMCDLILLCVIVLEIIPSDLAFDVSKFPLCNIEKCIVYDGKWK